MWVLANAESVADAVREPIAGEITERSVPWA
jgi:glutamyl-tRNA(Gln) amidotransferase subunit D